MSLFNEIYSGKKVLITGHTGFKGTWLTTWLHALGADVYGVSCDIPTSPSMFEALKLEEKVHHYQIDVRDYDALLEVMNEIKPDFVFHLAAQAIVSKSYTDPTDTITTNVIGTMNVLEVLRKINSPCVAVVITSDKCYDNVEWLYGYKETDALGGKDIYSGSKGAAELVFKSYYHSFFKGEQSNVRIVSARAGNVIGGGDWALDRIVPDCMRSWSNNKIVEIRSPLATRPWQHVLEPLSGYLNIGAMLLEDISLNGQSFNFGPKAEVSKTVKDLLEDLSICWEYKSPTEAYVITGNVKFHEAGLLKLNCDKALFYLKWHSALDYEQLLHFTGDWYYNYYKKSIDMLEYTQQQINEYTQIAQKRGVKWTK